MFFRFISFLIVLTVLVQTSPARAHSGLVVAFDELNYGLIVEWDQKNIAFYEAQIKKFQSQISLLQAEGLTEGELKAFLKSEINDEGLLNNLEDELNLLDISKMNNTEVAAYIRNVAERKYSVGASWNGEALHYAFVGVVLVAFFTGMIYYRSTFNNPPFPENK